MAIYIYIILLFIVKMRISPWIFAVFSIMFRYQLVPPGEYTAENIRHSDHSCRFWSFGLVFLII